MYEKELVSVVVPSFNHGKYIDKTIKSVMNQTYENIELIVIDDKSSDNSIDIIKSLESDIKNRFDNYQFIFKDANLGLTDSLNRGLYLAKGEYFTYIQSDDVIYKDKIYLSVETFKKLSEDYSFIFSDVFFIDEEDNLTYYTSEGKKFDTWMKLMRYHYPWLNSKDICHYGFLIRGNFIPAMGNFFRKRWLEKVNGWSEFLYYKDKKLKFINEDYPMWLKLSKVSKFYFLDNQLAYFRIHKKNTSTTKAKDSNIEVLYLLLNEHEYCRKNGYIKDLEINLFKYLKRAKISLKEKLKILTEYNLSKDFIKWRLRKSVPKFS